MRGKQQALGNEQLTMSNTQIAIINYPFLLLGYTNFSSIRLTLPLRRVLILHHAPATVTGK